MKTTTALTIRRNTAVLAETLVENNLVNMTREEVPIGASLWGFDPDDTANHPAVFKSEDPGTREWTQHTTEPFNLVKWAAKKVPLKDPEGQEHDAGVRVCLFDTDGETLTFVSVGICASLDLIRTLRGDGPYDPPIPVVVVQVKTRSGFATLKLRPVDKTTDAKNRKS